MRKPLINLTRESWSERRWWRREGKCAKDNHKVSVNFAPWLVEDFPAFDSRESWEEAEMWKLIIIGLEAQSAHYEDLLRHWCGISCPNQPITNWSLSVSSALCVIKAIAFIVTGAAQSVLIISTTVNYFIHFVLFSSFFGSCFLFSGLLPNKSIDHFRLFFSYQWNFFARRKLSRWRLIDSKIMPR